MHFNLVDGLLLALVAGAALDGARRGFSVYATELVAFGTGLGVAFVLFAPISGALHSALAVPLPLAGFGIFLILLVITHAAIQSALARRLAGIGRRIGVEPAGPGPGRLGALPAAGAAVLLAIVILSALVVLPVGGRTVVLSSALGSTITQQAAFLQAPMGRLLVPDGERSQKLVVPRVPPDAGADAFYSLQFPEQLEVALDVPAENRTLVLVNRVRQQNGLRPLQMDPVLQAAARDHSLDMYQRHYFSHLTPDGKSPFDRMRSLQARFVTAGENIAFAPDADQAFQSLLASPDHRANLLNPDFRCVGMGVYRASGYEEMLTQDFTDCG